MDQGQDLLTFHCVIRDRYPVDAMVLKIHIKYVCCHTYSAISLCPAHKILDQTHIRLEKESGMAVVDQAEGKQGRKGLLPQLSPLGSWDIRGQSMQVDD